MFPAWSHYKCHFSFSKLLFSPMHGSSGGVRGVWSPLQNSNFFKLHVHYKINKNMPRTPLQTQITVWPILETFRELSITFRNKGGVWVTLHPTCTCTPIKHTCLTNVVPMKNAFKKIKEGACTSTSISWIFYGLQAPQNLHPLFFRMYISFDLTIIILLTQLKVNVTMAALGTVCRRCSGRLFRCLPSIVNGNVSNRYLMI